MDPSQAKSDQTPGSSKPGQVSLAPAKIVYREYVPGDGFVTGIADYADPGGLGKFHLRVSGQREAIDQYAQNARIAKMQLTPVRDDTKALFEEHRQSALAAKRQWWYAQLDALKKIVQDTNDLARLNDPNWLWRQGPGAPNEATTRQPNIKLSSDRLIEIEPVLQREEYGSYLLSVNIDPTFIPFRGIDVYNPLIPLGGRTSQVWGMTRPTGGNPDLYLHLYCLEDRGANPRTKASSGLPANFDDIVCVPDIVNECVQGGVWRLHVYGASDANYDLYGDWRFDIPIRPIG